MNQTKNNTRLFLGILILVDMVKRISALFVDPIIEKSPEEIDGQNLWIYTILLLLAVFSIAFHNYKAGSILIIIESGLFIFNACCQTYVSAANSMQEDGTFSIGIAYGIIFVFTTTLLVAICTLILAIQTLKADPLRRTMGIYYVVMGASYALYKICNMIYLKASYDYSYSFWTVAIVFCAAVVELATGIIILCTGKKRFPVAAGILCGIQILATVGISLWSIIEILVDGDTISVGEQYSLATYLTSILGIVLPIMTIIFLRKSGKNCITEA